MNINLPYEIGTVLKAKEFDKIHYDRVHHYIIGDKIQVVLELCYATNPRLSIPIDMERFMQKWEVCNTKC